jgi:hypothetical protein
VNEAQGCTIFRLLPDPGSLKTCRKMAGQGEMFQELEEKRREDGFFPKLHKAGQRNSLFFTQSKNYVIKTYMSGNFFS